MAAKIARNEQRKLFAAYLNGLATTTFGVGAFAQVVSLAKTLQLDVNASLFALICVGVSILLHLFAHLALDSMEE